MISAALLIASMLLLLLVPYLKNPFNDFDYYGRPISRLAPNFTLKDTNGSPVSLADFHGRFVYLMFGYLGCRDVCHSQALTFYMLNKRIKTEKVHFLYVGMDPEHDTPEKIAAYFDSRAANFNGLVAESLRQVQDIAITYNAYFSIEPDSRYGGYGINHPGHIFLIDPAGELRLVYSGALLNAEGMIGDLKHVALDFSKT